MHVLLFGEITIILFIYIKFYWKVIFYYSFYKYIIGLEMSTIKYVSRYKKLKKRRKIN